MTIIVFLIDTSASMNQRAYLGGRPTLLDVAKSAVETFVKQKHSIRISERLFLIWEHKCDLEWNNVSSSCSDIDVRQRSPESRGDRYMLLTFEETPHNIKAGWKENLATFMNELKNLQCVGLTTLGAALKNAFDVLNLNRMQTGIDTYGQGRCPFYLEPSVIVVITDGGKYTTANGVHPDFTLPMHSPIPGSELTKEPFRWDQRLFSLVLRLSGTPAVERDTGLVPSDASPIDAMCEVTGGRSYCITSHRMMMQCIDSLVQKVQSGVVINFEKIGPDPIPLPNEATTIINLENGEENHHDEENGIQSNGRGHPNSNSIPNNLSNSTAWHSCRRLIYVPRSAQKGFAVGFWPIPESFWPDIAASSLPPRSAHPNVKFTCMSQEPLVIENLPFDKYELEPSPLTQYILARKQPTVCWQVFIANSYKSSEVGHPFGYLKASTNLTCVNLFVMPYNYPVLLPLLDDLFKNHRLKPSNEWRTQFQNYMRTMPAYYAASLRRALTRMGAPAALAQTLIPDNMDNTLSYSVLNYLKRLKNTAKMEFDRLCNEVISKQQANKSLANNSNTLVEGLRVTARANLKKDLSNSLNDMRDEFNKFQGFMVGLVKNHSAQRGAQSYRNAFDIPRKSLLDQVVRMRANFLQPGLLHTKLLDDDFVHSMPISQMGNYQEYLKRMTPPLREIESTPVRQHMFGNPFKIDKRMMVDEADIDMVGATSSASKGLKRSIAVVDSGVGNLNSSRPPSKRKPGPIPKDVIVRRPTYSPPNTPPASPIPWSEDVKSPLSPSMMMLKNDLKAESATPVQAKLVNGDVTMVEEEQKQQPQQLPSNGVSETTATTTTTTTTTLNSSSASASAITRTEQVVKSDQPMKLLVEPLPLPPQQPSTLTPNNSAVKLKCSEQQQQQLAESSACSSPGSSRCSTPQPQQQQQQQLPISNHVGEKKEKVAIAETKKELLLLLPPDKPLTHKELEDVKRHNLPIRNELYKEIRRKNTNFGIFLTHLEMIQGTLDIRLSFVRDIIRETLRFKRRKLVDQLEEYLKKLQKEGNKGLLLNHKMLPNGANRIA